MADIPKQTNPWKVGFIILVIAAVLWIGYAVAVPRFAMSWEKSNHFGGMFGGIGALFSGLALAGVVVAILMQKEELELQRNELVKSVAAQTASSEALTKQLELMSISAQLTALDTMYRHHTERVQRFNTSISNMHGVDMKTGTPALIRRQAADARARLEKVVLRIDTLVTDLETRTATQPTA